MVRARFLTSNTNRKILNRMISAMVATAMLILVFSASGLSVSAAQTSGYWPDYAIEPAYDSNSGTYFIGSAEELAWVAKKVNSTHPETNEYTSFELTADIDLAGHEWVPIGANYDMNLSYSFNGMGHSILNLRIESIQSPGIQYSDIGLFGVVFQNTEIWDVNVLNAYIRVTGPGNTGASNQVDGVGILAGTSNGALISGCSATGTVTATGCYYVAGLIGSVEGGTIKGSCSDSTVSAIGDESSDKAGGLVGEADLKASIINCYSQGSVSANFQRGGLVGGVYGATVENCYSTANVLYGMGDAGGLIGICENSAVNNCYSTGIVSSAGGSLGSYGGAFIGELFSSTVKNSFCRQRAAIETFVGYNPNLLILEIEAVSADYMKSNDFVNALNSGILDNGSYSRWLRDSKNTNNSYPVLESTWIPAFEVPGQVAFPASASVNINGAPVAFKAYNINDNNYFKLRDLAQALSGTDKHFNVTWNGDLGAIDIRSLTAYETVGGELASASGAAGSQLAVLSQTAIYLDGTEIGITAYTINDNNYFKLRDIASVFNFGVTFNISTETIEINTAAEYSN